MVGVAPRPSCTCSTITNAGSPCVSTTAPYPTEGRNLHPLRRGICGSPDTFFTSVLRQAKRQLNTYRNGEIKTLLADLLG